VPPDRKQRFDLSGVDLSQLNLDHIDLDLDAEERTSPIWRYLALLVLVGLGALLLWFPSSSYYQSFAGAHWVFLVMCVTAVVVGISLGRWLWAWAQEMAAKAPTRAEPRKEAAAPPSAFRRWVTLLMVVGGGAAILYGIPAWTGSARTGSFDGLWFVAALGGIAVGGMLVRWLLMQAAARPQSPAPRFVPPAWLKWVTLVVLIGGAATALVGSALAEADSSTRFALSGIGFAVGLLGAIWLARRFEEAEEKLRESGRRPRR